MQRSRVVTAPVAQRIVERTMQQLGHNVNVMDDEGVIVGTGEADRLGTVHEGALLAIRGRRTIVVDEAMGQRLWGVRPGVNLPLVVGGDVVGAIGVSGDPETVGQVADLLRLTAELMIEQAGAMDDDAWRSSRLDALVQALISVDGEGAAARIAAEMDVDLTVERYGLVVAARRTGDAAVLREVRRALHRGRTDVLTSRSDPDALLVLVPVSAEVSDLLRDIGPLRRRVTMAVGGRFGLQGLEASTATALDALARRAPDADEAIVQFDDDRFTALISGLEEGWRTRALATPWQRLRDADREVARTVVAYWDSDADLTRCAESLRIHRNTLRNRLDRVEQLSGVSVRDVRGMAELVVGAVLTGDLCMRTVSGQSTVANAGRGDDAPGPTPV